MFDEKLFILLLGVVSFVFWLVVRVVGLIISYHFAFSYISLGASAVCTVLIFGGFWLVNKQMKTARAYG